MRRLAVLPCAEAPPLSPPPVAPDWGTQSPRVGIAERLHLGQFCFSTFVVKIGLLLHSRKVGPDHRIIRLGLHLIFEPVGGTGKGRVEGGGGREPLRDPRRTK
eukprot:scaffold5808_cov128-Isochrysis_galbana.AAC.7